MFTAGLLSPLGTHESIILPPNLYAKHEYMGIFLRSKSSHEIFKREMTPILKSSARLLEVTSKNRGAICWGVFGNKTFCQDSCLEVLIGIPVRTSGVYPRLGLL